MARADTSNTLSAFATQYPGSLSLGTSSAFAQATFSAKGFFATKFFSKLRLLFHACQVPLVTLGSGIYRNPSCMPGPLTSAFVQPPNFMLDLLDKQYTGESLPGDVS